MPNLSLHPQVQRDLTEILEYYHMEGGKELEARFFNEAQRVIELIDIKPKQFHFIDRHYRKANFKTFPYHFIFEITLRGPRVTVLKHHKRHPRYGGGRR